MKSYKKKSNLISISFFNSQKNDFFIFYIKYICINKSSIYCDTTTRISIASNLEDERVFVNDYLLSQEQDGP